MPEERPEFPADKLRAAVPHDAQARERIDALHRGARLAASGRCNYQGPRRRAPQACTADCSHRQLV